MDCHYHPGRESTSTCTVCGKQLCPECSMEIAGKVYCKDCLERIIGMSDAAAAAPAPSQNPISDTLQEMDTQYDYYERETPYSEQPQTREEIIGDVLSNENTQQPNYDNSPYSLNNFEDPAYPPQGYNDPYANQNVYEPQTPQEPQYNQEEYYQTPQEPQYNQYQEPQAIDDGYIYPDHSYQPPENPNLSIENKYESYLDDLYFDEPDIPLSDQIAKDEEVYGSLTKNPYQQQETVAVKEQYYEAPVNEYQPYMPQGGDYQEEGFININNVQHNNPQGDYIQQPPQTPPAPKKGGIRRRKNKKQENNIVDGGMRPSTKSIHNIRNMEEEKEPYGAVDIILTIILIVLIIIVVFYIVYLFLLSNTYPTFLDAILGLKDPGVFFGNLLGK